MGTIRSGAGSGGGGVRDEQSPQADGVTRADAQEQG